VGHTRPETFLATPVTGTLIAASRSLPLMSKLKRQQDVIACVARSSYRWLQPTLTSSRYMQTWPPVSTNSHYLGNCVSSNYFLNPNGSLGYRNMHLEDVLRDIETEEFHLHSATPGRLMSTSRTGSSPSGRSGFGKLTVKGRQRTP
jgi:hypothetical protein